MGSAAIVRVGLEDLDGFLLVASGFFERFLALIDRNPRAGAKLHDVGSGDWHKTKWKKKSGKWKNPFYSSDEVFFLLSERAAEMVFRMSVTDFTASSFAGIQSVKSFGSALLSQMP